MSVKSQMWQTFEALLKNLKLNVTAQPIIINNIIISTSLSNSVTSVESDLLGEETVGTPAAPPLCPPAENPPPKTLTCPRCSAEEK